MLLKCCVSSSIVCGDRVRKIITLSTVTYGHEPTFQLCMRFTKEDGERKIEKRGVRHREDVLA